MHFLSLFRDRMVVRTGKPGAGSSSGTKLFHIRGTSAIDTRAVEVKPQVYRHAHTVQTALV